MPRDLFSKVWWLWIGTNDLAHGGCSVEATALNILRTAEEIAVRNPDAAIVLMAILPRSSRADGSLDVIEFFAKNNEEPFMWSSIQAVNEQLKEFCEQNDHMIYYDASAFFIEGHTHQEVNGDDFMPDNVHPNFHGYKILGKGIEQELFRIILDEGQADVVPSTGQEYD
jgi:lysophospholipase L1-like esterase